MVNGCTRNYLTKAREKKNLTMRKTASLAGISYQHYSKIENGEKGSKLSLRIMARIADVLCISLDELNSFEKEYQVSIGNFDY